MMQSLIVCVIPFVCIFFLSATVLIKVDLAGFVNTDKEMYVFLAHCDCFLSRILPGG